MSAKKELRRMVRLLVETLADSKHRGRDLGARCHGCGRFGYVHPEDLLCRWCFAAKVAIQGMGKPKG